MKLTKERLIQIIKEEMETIEELQPAGGSGSNYADAPRTAAPVKKQQTDVEYIMKLVREKIAGNIEYLQIMNAMVSLDAPEVGVGPSKHQSIIRLMRDKMNGIITGKEVSK